MLKAERSNQSPSVGLLSSFAFLPTTSAQYTQIVAEFALGCKWSRSHKTSFCPDVDLNPYCLVWHCFSCITRVQKNLTSNKLHSVFLKPVVFCNKISFKLHLHCCLMIFCRLKEPEPVNRAKFPIFGSKFRYSGRTQYQSRNAASGIDRQAPTVDRSASRRFTGSHPLDTTGEVIRTMGEVMRSLGQVIGSTGGVLVLVGRAKSQKAAVIRLVQRVS